MKEGYKQTEIGVIPEDWDVGSLREAFPKLDAGVSVNSDERAYSDYYILKTSAVRNGIVNIKEAKPVVRADYSRLKCSVKKGSIIISRMNTPAMVGECGFSVDGASNTFLPDRLWQVEPSSPDYDFQWLNYLLNTEKYSAAIRATATGTSNSMKNIAKERLLEISIPKPIMPEQQRIAKALSDLDELIASLEKLIAKKKAIKQGAMQELLTGKRRLPGFAGEWKEQVMKDYVDFQVGFPFSSSYFNGCSLGLRLIRNRDLKSDDQIIYSTELVDASFLVGNGDVLIGMDGDFLPCIWEKGRALLNQRVGKLLFSDSMIDRFALYAFQKPLMELQDGTGATTVKHLSHGDIKKLRVLVPPTKEEQKAVASFLTDLDGEIQQYEDRVLKARQIKQGMKQQLLTGRIRLN